MKGFLLGSALTLSLSASGAALFRPQVTALLIGDVPVIANVRIGVGCDASVCADRSEGAIVKGVSIDASNDRDGISFKTISSDLVAYGCGERACALRMHH